MTKYLAYVKFETVFDKKATTDMFAVIGTDSEDILEKAKKYGTEPVFASSMYVLNNGWW